MKFKLQLLVIIIGTFLSSNLFAKETITWMIVDSPPFEIVTNKPNSGIAGEARKLIEKKLSEYNHESIVVNYARMMGNFKKGNYCTMSLFVTEERKKFLYFSMVPDILFSSIGIAMREVTFKQIKKPAQISLEMMLRDYPDYRLGIAQGRNYNPKIRTVLNKYKDKSKISIHSQLNVDESLLSMILLGRLDYMLIYPHAATYMSTKLNYKNSHAFVPITEVDTFGQTFAACSKNEWGRQLIKKINQALVDLRPAPEYRQLYNQWIGKNHISLYQKYYEEFFFKFNRDDREW